MFPGRENMIKRFHSEGYNLVFDTDTGFMARWGKTQDEDPVMCPVGPEIADIEISTICHGIGKDMASRRPCSFCYKANTGCGTNMSLATFRKVLATFPKVLTQVALGIGDIDSNPDLWDIMTHCRVNGVVPNLTTNGMGVTDWIAAKLASRCGAVAVSHYGMDDLCFGTVERLNGAGLKQVNIHKLIARESYESCFTLIDKVKSDPRLAGLKAIVFLLLKPKGERNRYSPLTDLDQYRKLVAYALEKGVAIGMDSCSAPMALRSLPASAIPSIEPCESGLFSIYVNAAGQLFPCSFSEGTPGWETGVDLLTAGDFTKDVWHGSRMETWRAGLLGSSTGCRGCSVQKFCRSCPIYPVTLCKEVTP
jgi:radical SAM protein with 4Fe4S-binding SPASM domain